MTAGDLAVREHTLCHRAATFETATDAALHAVLIDNAALSVMDTSELEDMRAALIADGHAYDAAAEAAGVPMADRFAWQSYLHTTRRQQPAEHRRLAEHSDFQSNAPGLPRRIMSRTRRRLLRAQGAAGIGQPGGSASTSCTSVVSGVRAT